MNNFDKDLALEIQENEKRVNAYELNIDKECEDFIALRQPVATDLRFALSTLKINTNLERIADIASGIAEFISDIDQSVNPEIIHLLQAEKMFGHLHRNGEGSQRSLSIRKHSTRTDYFSTRQITRSDQRPGQSSRIGMS
ncbi:MAG: hypothetical protein IPN13_14950 [Bacteroidetes bacterium]|nr:hypothetical protein [Bacteroidota bacterium]